MPRELGEFEQLAHFAIQDVQHSLTQERAKRLVPIGVEKDQAGIPLVGFDGEVKVCW